jgi:hypothetical protein
MEKLVSLLYNKEKASNAFFGKNVNKSVHFFVYGVRLTFAVFINNGSQIVLGTSQLYGLVKYDGLLSNRLYGGETIR